MGHFYVLLGLTALVLLALVLSVRPYVSRRYRWPYLADPTFLSPDQQTFLRHLETLLGEDYRIHGRVRAADVIGINRRLGRRWRERADRRLGERIFDFLICRADSGAIGCAVALSPPSRWRSAPGHDRLDAICAAAGLPLVRFRVAEHYDAAAIGRAVLGAMGDLESQAPAAARLDPRPEALESLDSLDALEPRRAPKLRLDETPVLDEEPRFAIGSDLEEGEAGR